MVQFLSHQKTLYPIPLAEYILKNKTNSISKRNEFYLTLELLISLGEFFLKIQKFYFEQTQFPATFKFCYTYRPKYHSFFFDFRLSAWGSLIWLLDHFSINIYKKKILRLEKYLLKIKVKFHVYKMYRFSNKNYQKTTFFTKEKYDDQHYYVCN